MVKQLFSTIRKLNHVLMTRANWQCTGGLSSFTLELASFNQPLHIHSPVDWNLQRNHRLNRMFIDLACQKVKTVLFFSISQFQDALLQGHRKIKEIYYITKFD